MLYREETRKVYAEGRTPGRIVYPPRGNSGLVWDPVVVPRGQNSTCDELSAEIKDQIGHRGDAQRELARKLAPP